MRPISVFVLPGLIFLCSAAPAALADQVEMQNGDRYVGKVLSMSGTNVVFESEVLGKINVPRKNVAGMVFGTNTVAAKATTNVLHIATTTPAPLNLSSPAPATTAVSAAPKTASASASTNAADTDLSAALRNLGGDSSFIRDIRDKMLAGSPGASAKYDEMVNSLTTGKMDMNDLRRQAAASAEQIRQMKRELGPGGDETLDGYLQILDTFLKQSGTGASQ